MTFFRNADSVHADGLLLRIKDANIGCFIIQLEVRLRPNIGNTLRPVLMVFTRSGINPPKVNRFGWNMEHSGCILGGWPWQILRAIGAVARAREPGEFFWHDKQRTIHVRYFCRPSVCLSVICLSVCNALALYLGGCKFRQFFYEKLPWPSTDKHKTFYAYRPRGTLRRGS